MSKFRWLIAMAVTLAAPSLLQAQATGTIQGTVTELGTDRPLQGAQVFIEGLQRGTLTNQQGRFQIPAVPAGTHSVRASLIGHTPADRAVTVTAGEVTTVNIRLESEAVALQEIVVTGVAGATTQAKVPFAISKIDAEDVQVPTVSASGAIQGKVAGATVTQGTGRPGAPPVILLRGPTSINASGRNQEPLYIVDGVILSSSMVDFDALDIQSIEVIKGAAGASLYGSRAGSGVIQITTKRGANVQDDQVRYTVRSEYGRSNLGNTPEALFSDVHQFAVDNGQFVTETGGRCDILECPGTPRLAGQRAAPGEEPTTWNTFMIEPYPGPTFNQVERFFQTGIFLQNYIAAEGRSGGTNFHISYSNLDDEGVMPGTDGFQRNNFRVNLDQAVRQDIQVSASAFYSRSEQTGFGEGSGNPMFDLTRVPAGVDITACEDNPTQSCIDEPQNLLLATDVFSRESPNPLYELLVVDRPRNRGRFLGNANLQYNPLAWLRLDGNISYDRLDSENTNFTPKGFRTLTPSANLNQGALSRTVSLTEGLNGSATATVNYSFGENITNRTQLRYLFETTDFRRTETSGNQFAVADVPVFDNINQSRLSAESTIQPVRADGYFAITNFDLYDRYVIDALIRNDGSSLFGEEERRQWYYRLAGAWRMAQEPWFNFPAVNEFKFRYAYGTAGGRPNFAAQYETYSVSGGSVTPVTLGNVNLKPEFTREHEAGIDAVFLDNRFQLSLTYADAVTEDQILQVPLPAYTGFSSQWRNAGTLASNTWEASLETRLFQTRDINWSARVLFDRTRQEITELNVPPYTYGVGGQGMGSVFYARPGEALGTFYGVQVATSCEHLPAGVDCGEFEVNRDGYLVWVGENGSLDNPMWGESADLNIRGSVPMWGEPIVGECEDRLTGERTTFCPLGKGLPDYKLSFSSNFDWRGLGVYALVDSWQGFSVYNQPLQWTLFKNLGGIMDQTGVPEARQKPVGYYARLYGVSGLAPSSAFVEDGSFVKLREVSLRYRLGERQLGGLPGLNNFSGMTLSLIGRNLATWTDYRGFDPEVGRGGGATGSAALARVEGYQYPPFRTFTLGVELNF